MQRQDCSRMHCNIKDPKMTLNDLELVSQFTPH